MRPTHSSDSAGDRWAAFIRSPFALPAAMLASVFVGVAGASLIWPRRAEQSSERVVLAPAVVQPPLDTPQPTPDEAPVVMIRPVPARVAPKPASESTTLNGPPPTQPLTSPSGSPQVAAVPSTTPAAPGLAPAAPAAVTPEIRMSAQPAPPVETAPVESPELETPRVEAPRVEPPRVETPRVEPPAEPAPEPRRRRRIARATPPRPSGKLSIYFDADSSTFDRGKNRAPLRVEVYVGGRKVMETDDPEKREFDVADLPEGVHEVAIIPHVGDAQPRPRRFRVEVDGNAETRVEAVLRRRDGTAMVGKLRARD